MKFVTKEFTLELLEKNIISHKVNLNCTRLTLEGAIEVIEQIKDLIPIDSKPTKLLTYVAPFYVKKQIVKLFISSIPIPISCIALVCPGYISKYVAGLAIKMHKRFNKEDHDQTQIQIFIKEDEAIEWLTSS